MVKNFINRLKANTVAKISILVLATVGASTAITWASIPDSSGVIHGCYSNRDGTLRVIDTNNGGTCSASKETALNWNQTVAGGSASVVLHDSNGQTLGTVIDYPVNNSSIIVYDSAINRIVQLDINYSDNTVSYGRQRGAVFTSTDCTGTPYVNPVSTIEATELYRLANTSGMYYVLNGNETPQNITVNSNLDDGGNCSTYSYPATEVAVTTIPAPYSTIALPIKL